MTKYHIIVPENLKNKKLAEELKNDINNIGCFLDEIYCEEIQFESQHAVGYRIYVDDIDSPSVRNKLKKLLLKKYPGSEITKIKKFLKYQFG